MCVKKYTKQAELGYATLISCVSVTIPIDSTPTQGFLDKKGLHITFNEAVRVYLKFFPTGKKNKATEKAFKIVVGILLWEQKPAPWNHQLVKSIL